MALTHLEDALMWLQKRTRSVSRAESKALTKSDMDIVILIVIIFCVFGGVGWGYRSNWQGGWVAPSNLLFVIVGRDPARVAAPRSGTSSPAINTAGSKPVARSRPWRCAGSRVEAGS